MRRLTTYLDADQPHDDELAAERSIFRSRHLDLPGAYAFSVVYKYRLFPTEESRPERSSVKYVYIVTPDSLYMSGSTSSTQNLFLDVGLLSTPNLVSSEKMAHLFFEFMLDKNMYLIDDLDSEWLLYSKERRCEDIDDHFVEPMVDWSEEGVIFRGWFVDGYDFNCVEYRIHVSKNLQIAVEQLR